VTDRLPYPPPFQDLRTLSAHVCMAESTIENAVKMGILPAPRILDGLRLWKWEEVAACLDGSVYFFEAGGLIKIGFSRNLKNRIQTLRDGLPYDGTLLHTIVGTERMESFLHARFATDKVRGEWFNRSAALLEYIDLLKAGHVPGQIE
jgi:hypothetical protein